MTHDSMPGASGDDAPALQLDLRADRRLIRPHGSNRHLVARVRVAPAPPSPQAERPPRALSLVLDRSGSMHGDKLAIARQAALAVLDRLDERDRIAAVIFDDRIDVLQEGAPATPEIKARLRAELSAVQARGSTALHEAWLTGCRAIAPNGQPAATLARCFLLTDGLANVGLTDTEQIATQAAGIREHAAVGTSTFGIGPDYDEGLLGPMAAAGGGQFHHLRNPHEIASTFLGELGELLAVVAAGVRLEIRAAPGTTAELVSPYWLHQPSETGWSWSVSLGDLLAGEERDVVVRLGFMSQLEHAGHLVRARVVWHCPDGSEAAADWQEVFFTYADHPARRAEQVDPTVQRLVGLHHAERARRRAIELSRSGDIAAARTLLRRVAARIAEYAGADPALQDALASLRAAERELEDRGYQPLLAKEAYFSSLARSRGQRDLRRG